MEKEIVRGANKEIIGDGGMLGISKFGVGSNFNTIQSLTDKNKGGRLCASSSSSSSGAATIGKNNR
ncbi:hypothetical protein BAG01nite_40950 [Brevibacillus agri]|uniref:Uncharacterized protein n=2 Tax=Brevibacillus TaxID=55080 RepID=A0A4Y3PM01_BREPA|nr:MULTISPECIES: hypothetical protein [Brevibacillus]MDR9504119.1 hypothetical protein [Brevibacillus agri]MED2255304.1 hypothetical protein [Brevibacillus parabrevis]QHZ54893.1 hypothetical protein M655_004060 [Brevibacillus sp. NSP2.1]UED68453.1 hypothetical protein HP435_24895 [Brevibacillus sp. HD3.3A]WDV94727.1 hypothetical protein PSE45_24310 [Brevibacillus parabrevis]